MNSRVKDHNVRQYTPRYHPPDFHNDLRMSREKVSVWIGICGNGSLVGPIFYENTLTGAKYLDLLTERIFPELHQIYPNRFNRLWWIQDGAPVHGSHSVREFLQGVFTDRIIALHHAIE